MTKSNQSKTQEFLTEFYTATETEIQAMYENMTNSFPNPVNFDFMDEVRELQNPSGYSPEVTFHTQPKLNSKLAKLTLLILSNSFGANPQVRTGDLTIITDQLFESLSEIAQKTKKTAEEILDESIKYYQDSPNLVEQATKLVAPALLSIPQQTLNQLRQGQRLTLPSLAQTAVKVALSSSVATEGAATQKKSESVEDYYKSFKSVFSLKRPLNKEELESYKSIFEKAKSEKKLTELLRLAPAYVQHNTLFALAIKTGHDELVELIFDAVKGKKKLLKELFDQTSGNDSAIIAALTSDTSNLLEIILSAINDDKELFDREFIQKPSHAFQLMHSADKIKTISKKFPELAEKMLRININGQSSIHLAIGAKVDPEKKLKAVLDLIGDNQKLLEEVLWQKNSAGDYPAHIVLENSPKMLEMIIGAIKDPKLLEKLFSQKYSDGSSFLSAIKSPIYRYKIMPLLKILAKDLPDLFEELLENEEYSLNKLINVRKTEFLHTILEAAQDNPKIIKKILDLKPIKGNNQRLPIFTELVIAGDFESIGIILKHFPDTKLEKLPPAFRSGATAKSLYYLEAFSENKPLYHRIENGVVTEFSINKVALQENEPVLITFPKKENRKVVLGELNLIPSDITDCAKSLKKMVDFANEQNVNTIVINTSLQIVEEGNHAITLKLSRDKDQKWNVEIHDPNNKNSLSEESIFTELTTSKIKELKKNSGISLKIIKADFRNKNEDPYLAEKLQSNVIVPNYSDEYIEGYCETVQSMASASIIMDDTSRLRKHCVEVGGYDCVKTLIKATNPKIDKILEDKLEFCKSEIKSKTPLPTPSKTSSQRLQHAESKGKEL